MLMVVRVDVGGYLGAVWGCGFSLSEEVDVEYPT